MSRGACGDLEKACAFAKDFAAADRANALPAAVENVPVAFAVSTAGHDAGFVAVAECCCERDFVGVFEEVCIFALQSDAFGVFL